MKWPHDCQKCVFLGEYNVAQEDGSVVEYELYYHYVDAKHAGILARFGPSTLSTIGCPACEECCAGDPVLAEGLARARKRGLFCESAVTLGDAPDPLEELKKSQILLDTMVKSIAGQLRDLPAVVVAEMTIAVRSLTPERLVAAAGCEELATLVVRLTGVGLAVLLQEMGQQALASRIDAAKDRANNN